MTTIINLTPHVIVLRKEDGTDVTIPPTAPAARVAATPGVLEDRGLPVQVASPTTFGEIENLPDAQDGVVYIVSMLVAERAARPDVLSPGTGPKDGAIRDENGMIAAVTRLIAWV